MRNGWEYVIGLDGVPLYKNSKLNIILVGVKTTKDLEEATQNAERRNKLPLDGRFKLRPKTAAVAAAAEASSAVVTTIAPPKATQQDKANIMYPNDQTDARLKFYNLTDLSNGVKSVLGRQAVIDSREPTASPPQQQQQHRQQQQQPQPQQEALAQQRQSTDIDTDIKRAAASQEALQWQQQPQPQHALANPETFKIAIEWYEANRRRQQQQEAENERQLQLSKSPRWVKSSTPLNQPTGPIFTFDPNKPGELDRLKYLSPEERLRHIAAENARHTADVLAMSSLASTSHKIKIQNDDVEEEERKRRLKAEKKVNASLKRMLASSNGADSILGTVWTGKEQQEREQREKNAKQAEVDRINGILDNLDKQLQKPRLTSNSEEDSTDDRNKRVAEHREKAKTRRIKNRKQGMPDDSTSESDSEGDSDAIPSVKSVIPKGDDVASALGMELSDVPIVNFPNSSVSSPTESLVNKLLEKRNGKAANDSPPPSIPHNGQYNVTIQYNQTPIQHTQQELPAVLRTEDDKVIITIGDDTVELNIYTLNELVFNLHKSSGMNTNCRDKNSSPRTDSSSNFSNSKCIKVTVRDSSSPSLAPTSITLPFVISFGSIKECDEFMIKVKHIQVVAAAEVAAAEVAAAALYRSYNPDMFNLHSERQQSSNSLASLSSRLYKSVGGKLSKRKRPTRKTRRFVRHNMRRRRTRKHKHKRTKRY